MSTRRDDEQILFRNLSIANYHTLSAAAAQQWAQLGCTASFQPRYTLNPASSSNTEQNEFMLTLAMLLSKVR